MLVIYRKWKVLIDEIDREIPARLFPGMTTKFQQRTIDLLTNRPAPLNHSSSSSSSAVNPFTLNHHHHHQLELEFSMDRIQDFKNIESMRKMMLIQEEIFKHQVQELHRLYKLQKYLMQDLENGLIRRQKAKTATINPMFSSPRWHHQTGHKIPRDDPKEASGAGCSVDNNNNNNNTAASRILPIKLGLAMPPETPITDQKRIDEENDVEVELTLSIGHCAGKKRPMNDPDRDQEQQLGSSSGKTDDYGDNTRPHWLLQDLCLNRT